MHAQTRICTAVIESRLRQAGCFTKPVQGLNAGLGQLQNRNAHRRAGTGKSRGGVIEEEKKELILNFLNDWRNKTIGSLQRPG